MQYLETCLLTAEADRVLCHLVMFLTVFFHSMYKMKYSCFLLFMGSRLASFSKISFSLHLA